jgi:hypothetical protein
MTFKPRIWFPIASVLTLVNVAAVGFAAQTAEVWHATVHAALGVGFALWAQRLRPGRPNTAVAQQLEALDVEMDALRQQLNEAEERLDFTERLLAQEPETRRIIRDP